MKNIDIFLRDKGIKPSYQRKRIYEFLCENPIHPTVNDIYSGLIHDIPTLSKATVYNTMNLFSLHELIDVIPIEGNEFRFDLRPAKPHAHFKCDCCHHVFNVEIEIPEHLISRELMGSRITTQNINFTGVCADCLKEEAGKAI